MEPQISITRQDFRNARPRLEPLRELRAKFCVLEESLLTLLPKQFNPMKRRGCHFVSRPNRRGGGYWHGVWLGLGSPTFHNPRQGLQFQFGIEDGSVFCCGVWMQGHGQTPLARRLAWSAINARPEEFSRRIRRLGSEYYLDIWNGHQFWRNAAEFSIHDVNQVLDILSDSESFLDISRELKNREVISWKEKLPNHIAMTFEKLYPIYSFLLSSGHIRKKRGSIPSPEKILESSIWAENLVRKFETTNGRIVKVVSDRPVGYDLESKDRKSGRIRRIEVKSRKIDGRIQLTPNEYRAARKYGSDYYVYVVRSKNDLRLIRNPVDSCNMMRRNQPVWEIMDWADRARAA